MRWTLVTLGFGFAASALLACGNSGFSEQPGPRLQGGSGGQAGTSAGMGGGTTQVVTGGSAGSSSMSPDEPDAGGAGEAGSSSEDFQYPKGCPEPAPRGIQGQKIAIQSFNFDTSEVVLKNISNTTQTLTGDRLGWQWCSFPSYWFIAPADVVLPPGKTYKFILNLNTEGVWKLPPEGAELAIYVQSGTFDEPDKMVSFISWGDGLANTGREYVATMAGLWTFMDRVDIYPGDHGIMAIGSTQLASGYQGVPARCLVAPPNQ